MGNMTGLATALEVAPPPRPKKPRPRPKTKRPKPGQYPEGWRMTCPTFTFSPLGPKIWPPVASTVITATTLTYPASKTRPKTGKAALVFNWLCFLAIVGWSWFLITRFV